ncbi:hypothetical protein [Ktedonobacter racemifer]|nr:hypothetical protein [Ktedonobacter racemifer]
MGSASLKYFDQRRHARAHSQAYDLAARRRLQQLSEQLTGLSNQQVL